MITKAANAGTIGLTPLIEGGLKELAAALVTQGYLEMADLGATEDAARTAIAAAAKARPPGEISRAIRLWAAWKAVAAAPASDAAGEIVDCPLATALAGLKDMARQLTQAGYRELSDLGDTEEKVRAAISSVVGKDYSQPGAVAQVVRLWKSARAFTGTVLDLPKLPADLGKGIDLTAPSVKFDNVEYKLPDNVAVAKADASIKTADQLNPLDWMLIAKHAGLTRAIDMTRALAAQDEKSLVLADEAAFLWRPPADCSFYESPAVTGQVTKFLAYSAATASLVHAKVHKGSLDIQTPFCSAAVEMSRTERLAQRSDRKTLYLSGAYQYLYATLNLTHCLVPADRFLMATHEALQAPSLELQGAALEAVFQRFGHLVPTRVTLGGELFFTITRETEGEVDEKSIETTITAAVAAKYEGVGAKLGGGTTSADKSSQEAQLIVEKAVWATSGGEEYLTDNPKEFPATTREPARWAIVSREGLRPLTSLLDADLRSQVEGVWRDWLRRYWGGVDAPPGYIRPDMYGLNFVLRDHMDDSKAWGVEAVLDPRGSPAALVSSNLLGSPIGDRLAWSLVYSGSNTPGGDPIYFIVEALTADQRAARAAAWVKRKQAVSDLGLGTDLDGVEPIHCARLLAQQGDNGWVVACEQVPEAGRDRPIKTNLAGWTLVPAEPQSERKASRGIPYLIRSSAMPQIGFGPVDTSGAPRITLVAADKLGVWYCHVPG